MNKVSSLHVKGGRRTGRGPKLPPPVPLFSWLPPFNPFRLLSIKHCWVSVPPYSSCFSPFQNFLPPFPPYLQCPFASPIFPSSHPSILCYKLRHALKGKDGKGQLMLARTQWTHATIPFCLYTSYKGKCWNTPTWKVKCKQIIILSHLWKNLLFYGCRS